MKNILKYAPCIAALFVSNVVTAQLAPRSEKARARAAGRIPTTVALRSTLFQGRSAVILRRPERSGGDLIVLSGPSVTPEQLASAAMALTANRDETGDVVTKPSMIAVSQSSGASGVDLQAAMRAFDSLRSAPHSTIAEIGDVQVMTIYLPSNAGRESLKQRGKAAFEIKGKKP